MRISDWSSDVCSSDLDAARLQGIGEAADVLEELTIGDVLLLGGAVALPDDGRVVPLGRQVTVEAVVAGVGGNVGVSAEERRVGKEWVSTNGSRWATSH